MNTNNSGNAQFDEAINYLKKSVQLEPNWDIAWFYYGYVLQAGSHFHQAIAAFNKAISLAGSDKKFVVETKEKMRDNENRVSQSSNANIKSSS